MSRLNQANVIGSYDDFDAPPNNKWLVAFKAALRGRIWIAVVIGGVLGIAGAGTIYTLIPPKFESTSLVSVKSTTPTIMYEISDNMGRYDQYLGAQVELIKSFRVTDMAMRSPEWSELGRGFTPDQQYRFRSAMNVSNNARSEVIRISFSDESAKASKAGASSIAQAYLDIFNEKENGQVRTHLSILESREADLRSKVDSIQDEISDLVQGQGREGVRLQYANHLELRNSIEWGIQQDADRLKIIQLAADSGNDLAVDDLTPEQAAKVSEKVSELLAKKDAIESELRSMRVLGRGEEDRLVVNASKKLEDIQSQLLDEMRSLTNEDLMGDSIEEGLSEAELQSRIASQQSRLVEVTQRIEDYGELIAQLNELEKEETILEGRLNSTRNRIDTLSLESAVVQRVEILSVETPPEPGNTKKKLAMCVVAGGAGLSFGFLLVGGLGVIGGRVRNSQDVMIGLEDRELIGLIPVVDSQSNPDSILMAEQSIDHIRSMLQVGESASEMFSVAVTGPISGSGKTSVSTLLGRSFADAGYKTLLVDFDFVGQGLSAQYRRSLAPRIGDLLEASFDVSRDEIEKAAQEGDPSKQLGDKLCSMGLISQEQLGQVLRLQAGGADPLSRVVAGKPIDECVVKTRVENLYALPLGDEDGGRVGQKAINRLLDAAKQSFEVMVMDTGPTPGAVEGGLAVASVSSVLMVVARGDERSDIETCDHFLRSVRAPVAGVVLNRADQLDLKSSHLSLSLSRRSQPSQSGGGLDQMMST